MRYFEWKILIKRILIRRLLYLKKYFFFFFDSTKLTSKIFKSENIVKIIFSFEKITVNFHRIFSLVVLVVSLLQRISHDGWCKWNHDLFVFKKAFFIYLLIHLLIHWIVNWMNLCVCFLAFETRERERKIYNLINHQW
jgi:hypothetical protein